MHRDTFVDFACLSWNLNEYLQPPKERRDSHECVVAVISDFYAQNEKQDMVLSFQGVSNETYTILKRRLVDTYDACVTFHFTPHRSQDDPTESDRVFGNVIILLTQAGRSTAGGGIRKIHCDSYNLSDPSGAVASLRLWTANNTLIEIIGLLSPGNVAHTTQLEWILDESTSDILIIAGVTNTSSFVFSGCEGHSPLSFPGAKPTLAVSDIWVRGRAVQHKTEVLRILLIEVSNSYCLVIFRGYLVYVQEVSNYLPITRRIENASCQSYVGNDCLIL